MFLSWIIRFNILSKNVFANPKMQHMNIWDQISHITLIQAHYMLIVH